MHIVIGKRLCILSLEKGYVYFHWKRLCIFSLEKGYVYFHWKSTMNIVTRKDVYIVLYKFKHVTYVALNCSHVRNHSA